MNIAFFLTPKSEVVYENIDANMRQVIERMERHGYTAVPMIDKEGRFAVEVKKHSRIKFPKCKYCKA